MDKKVTIIPPTQTVGAKDEQANNIKKIRVAAYCRVSTGSDEQATSYDNQVEEWTKRITANPNYELVEIYADQGISGTSSKNRDGFNRMISDAKTGKIDLILCKSISRFARNTALCIKTIRELKAIGIGIHFDNEHLDTLDEKSEFMFTIMSSMAQEESRHISENVRWTLKKKMEEGSPMVNTTRFLGYDKSADGSQLVINEDEAKIVRLIFNLYDSGEGCLKIAKILETRGYKTAAGCKNWYTSTILDILRNEKYIGNLLLQKTYTADYLGHIRKVNNGERPMYHVDDAHEAIISKEQWDRVQAKLALNKARSVGANHDMRKYTNRYPFSGVLVCAECGTTYKRRLWNSKSSNSKNLYQCNAYINQKDYEIKCHNKAVSENLGEKACCDVINKIFISKSKAFTKLASAIKSTLSTNKFDNDIAKKMNQKERLIKDIDEIIADKLNATTIDTKQKLNDRLDKLMSQCTQLNDEIAQLSTRKAELSESSERMNKMLSLLNMKMITPELLSNGMVSSFFAKIFVIGKNELVFVIDSSKTLSSDEMIEKRHSIIKREAIYENSITERDPIKKATIKYKVVLV